MRTVVAAAALWFLTSPATAVCMRPVPKACSLYFKSDAVFVAKVLADSYVDDSDYQRFDVRVSQVLRGSVPQSVSVFTGNDSGRVLWERGHSYVVFAQRKKGRLETSDGCGTLSDSTKVVELLQEIKALKSARGSLIEGEILTLPPEGTGIDGVEVRAVGASRTYKGKSDRNGYFRIRVPPGRYDVSVDPSLAVLSDLSRGSQNGFLLQRGQCMQLQFGAP